MALGVALGIPAALAASRLLKEFLYGVPASDPVTYVAIAGLMIGVGLLAGWLPARRAARVDPMVALRQD